MAGSTQESGRSLPIGGSAAPLNSGIRLKSGGLAHPDLGVGASLEDDGTMRLPDLSYVLKRRLAWGGSCLGALLLWRGILMWGPGLAHRGEGLPPAMFRFQARGLIKAYLDYPRQVEGYLPAPGRGTGPAAQLALMGWWDGHTWTPKALKRGRLEGTGLQVRLGRLEVVGIAEVTPVRDYNGPQLCQADYRVRWETSLFDQELLKADRLVGLRYPKGLRTPGEELPLQVTLERTPFSWAVQDARALAASGSGPGSKGWAWLRWLL
jgi:hypothetical protein